MDYRVKPDNDINKKNVTLGLFSHLLPSASFLLTVILWLFFLTVILWLDQSIQY